MALNSIFKKKRLSSVGMHILAWITAYFISSLKILDLDISIKFDDSNIIYWVFYIVTFYITYLLLIPKFLNKARHLVFILLSVILIAALYTSLKISSNYYFLSDFTDPVKKEEIMQKINNREKAKFADINTRKDVVNHIFAPRTFSLLDIRNANNLYSILVVYFIAVVIGYAKETRRNEEKRKEEERERISSELEYLKQQINPHFLFNALNSIYSLAILNSDKSPDAILKLSNILRYMLYETDKDKVLLSDEIEIIDSYIGLQRLRLTDSTSINITKSGNFTPYRIEPMLLIPLLENAVKYGIDTSKKSSIDIEIAISDDGMLMLHCTNSIVKQNNDNKNSGIGIKNIRRRLELLSRAYSLDIKSENGIFDVRLTIELSK